MKNNLIDKLIILLAALIISILLILINIEHNYLINLFVKIIAITGFIISIYEFFKFKN